MSSTRVVKQVVAEVRGKSDALDRDLAAAEARIARTKREVEGLGTAAQGMGAKYGGAATRIAGATEAIARSGEVSAASAKQLLSSGSAIAFAFGPAGAAVGALSIFALAVATAMGRARAEVRQTAESFDQELARIGGTRDYRSAGGLLTRILVGDPAAAKRELQIPLQQLEREVAESRARFRRLLPNGGTEELGLASVAQRREIAAREAILKERQRQLEAAQAQFATLARLEQERLATGKKLADDERALLEEKQRVERAFAEASKRVAAATEAFDREVQQFGTGFGRLALRELATAAEQVAAEFDELLDLGRRTVGSSDPRVQRLEALKAAAVEAAQAIASADQALLDADLLKDRGEAPGVAVFDRLSAEADRLRASLAQLTPGSERYLRVQQQLLKVQRELQTLFGGLGDASAGAAGGPARTAADIAREMQQAADGALQLAAAFGSIDQSSARALRSISQIAGNIPALEQALAAGSGLGIVSAALPIAGALASLVGGDARRREELRKNTEALRELTDKAGLLGIGVSGVQASQARATLAQLFAEQQRIEGLTGQRIDPRRAAQSLGIGLGSLERLAAELGITLGDSTKSFRQLEAALADTITKLGEFGTDLLSQQRQAAAEIELFGITDPLEQLRLRTGAVSGRSAAFDRVLAGLDLSTAEGREQARANARILFDILRAGGQTLGAADLGGLTGDELLEALLALVRGLNEVDEALGLNTTTATQLDRIVTADRTQITADQASRLLGLAAQQLSELRIIREALTAARTPVPLPDGSVFAATPGSAVVHVRIENVFHGPVTGAEVADASLDALVEAVRRALGRDVTVRRQYLGASGLRA